MSPVTPIPPGKVAPALLRGCRTFVFDFDSTLIKYESLEVMLQEVMANDPKCQEKLAQIEDLTKQGMNGEISFREGLEARLRIAEPTTKDIDNFVKKHCPAGFSPGAPELVRDLKAAGKEVLIISGGFKDLIVPFAKYLDISSNKVFAVEIEWDKDTGAVKKLDPNNNGFLESKVEGSRRVQQNVDGLQTANGPIAAIGDGYTDYQLYAQGIADTFVAFTQFAKREKVTSVAPQCVGSMEELRAAVLDG